MWYTYSRGGGIVVEYQNITLSIPKEVLKKVKHIAIEKNTSVSGLLSQTLEDIVNQETGYQRAKERQLILMESGIDIGLSGKRKWNREELHER
jgi:hypothetical protein